jgi:hypothetical protein
MIPRLNIVAWSQTTPWTEQRQVEQESVGWAKALLAPCPPSFVSNVFAPDGGHAHRARIAHPMALPTLRAVRREALLP